jgi:hypothetical protein
MMILTLVFALVFGGCSAFLAGSPQQKGQIAAQTVIEMGKQADGALKGWTDLVYSAPMDQNTKQQANNYAEWFNFAAKALGIIAQVALPLLL